MYRNYEEYMRTVLGYNTGFTNQNPYINPYSGIAFNNIDKPKMIQENNFEKDEFEENNSIVQEKDIDSKNQYYRENRELNNNKMYNNINRNTEFNQKQNQKHMQNATSYKNFLRF